MGRHEWMGMRSEAREGAKATGRWAGSRLAALGLGLAVLGGIGGVGAVATAAPASTSATPCEESAKVCASLSTNEAWLTDGEGEVLRGPVRMSHGSAGKETPVGTFAVQRKEEVHLSREYDDARMPWSVFFDDHGHAFHGGDPASQSAGCVRMADDDAQAFFNSLDVYDEVQIVE